MVTVRITESLKKVFDELKEREGLSYADLIKKGLTAAGDESAATQAAIQAAYHKGRRKGWDDAKREPVSIGTCSLCGKPMQWILTEKEDWLVLDAVITVQGLHHPACKKR